MSVKIRLKRMGSKKRPFYRIVATDSRMPRDGRFIEILGYYDPIDPPALEIKEDLVLKWMQRGAVPSENTESLFRRTGLMKKWALIKQGVPAEQLDARLEELRARETPAMSADERQAKEAARKAEAEKAEAEKAEAEKAEAEKAEAEKAEAEKAAAEKAEAEKAEAEKAEAEKAAAEKAEAEKAEAEKATAAEAAAPEAAESTGGDEPAPSGDEKSGA